MPVEEEGPLRGQALPAGSTEAAVWEEFSSERRGPPDGGLAHLDQGDADRFDDDRRHLDAEPDLGEVDLAVARHPDCVHTIRQTGGSSSGSVRLTSDRDDEHNCQEGQREGLGPERKGGEEDRDRRETLEDVDEGDGAEQVGPVGQDQREGEQKSDR